MAALLRSLAVAALVAVTLMTVALAESAEPEPDIPAHHHVWGHFAPGAWVKTRAVTLDGRGDEATQKITQLTTTLKRADDESYTLEIETQRTVAGRPLEPTVLELPPSGYFGKDPKLKPIVTAIGDAQLQIGKNTIPCRVKRIEIDDSDHNERTVAKVWYAADTSPHILRQEVVTERRSGEGGVAGEEISRRDVQVMMLDVTFAGPDDIPRQGAYVFQTLKRADSILAVWQLTSDVVPGSVVWQITRDRDAAGKLRSETTLTLVAYGLEPVSDAAAAKAVAGATKASAPKSGTTEKQSSSRLRLPLDMSRLSPAGTLWTYRPNRDVDSRAKRTRSHSGSDRRGAAPH